MNTGNTTYDSKRVYQSLAALTASCINHLVELVAKYHDPFIDQLVHSTLQRKDLKEDAKSFLYLEMMEQGRKNDKLLSLFNLQDQQFRWFLAGFCKNQFCSTSSKWYKEYIRYDHLHESEPDIFQQHDGLEFDEVDFQKKQDHIKEFINNVNHILNNNYEIKQYEKTLWGIKRFNVWNKEPYLDPSENFEKTPTYMKLEADLNLSRSQISAVVNKVDRIIEAEYKKLFGEDPPDFTGWCVL